MGELELTLVNEQGTRETRARVDRMLVQDAAGWSDWVLKRPHEGGDGALMSVLPSEVDAASSGWLLRKIMHEGMIRRQDMIKMSNKLEARESLKAYMRRRDHELTVFYKWTEWLRRVERTPRARLETVRHELLTQARIYEHHAMFGRGKYSGVLMRACEDAADYAEWRLITEH